MLDLLERARAIANTDKNIAYISRASSEEVRNVARGLLKIVDEIERATIGAAASRIGARIVTTNLITKEARATRIGLILAQDDVLAMRNLDPRDEDPFFDGIFRANTCGYCADGRLPCLEGAPYRCGRPRARND